MTFLAEKNDAVKKIAEVPVTPAKDVVVIFANRKKLREHFKNAMPDIRNVFQKTHAKLNLDGHKNTKNHTQHRDNPFVESLKAVYGFEIPFTYDETMADAGCFARAILNNKIKLAGENTNGELTYTVAI